MRREIRDMTADSRLVRVNFGEAPLDMTYQSAPSKPQRWCGVVFTPTFARQKPLLDLMRVRAVATQRGLRYAWRMSVAPLEARAERVAAGYFGIFSKRLLPIWV